MRCSFGRLMIGIPSVDESNWIATYRPALWTPIWTQYFGCFWTPSRIVGIATWTHFFGCFWTPSGLLLDFLWTSSGLLLDSFWPSSGLFLGYLIFLPQPSDLLLHLALNSVHILASELSIWLYLSFSKWPNAPYYKSKSNIKNKKKRKEKKRKKKKKTGIYLAACLHLFNRFQYSYTDLAC